MRIAAIALAALLASAAGAQAQDAPPAPDAFMAQNAKADGVQVLPSGVEYKVIKAGPQISRHPTPADIVTVQYDGSLLNGQVFDSSSKNPSGDATFPLKGLIQGWVDVVQQMKEGDEWMVWIPPSAGYGDKQKGPIPPNSVLVFRLKLVSILGG